MMMLTKTQTAYEHPCQQFCEGVYNFRESIPACKIITVRWHKCPTMQYSNDDDMTDSDKKRAMWQKQLFSLALSENSLAVIFFLN